MPVLAKSTEDLDAESTKTTTTPARAVSAKENKFKGPRSTTDGNLFKTSGSRPASSSFNSRRASGTNLAGAAADSDEEDMESTPLGPPGNLRPEAAAKTADSGAGKPGKKGKKKDGGGGGLYPFLDKKDKDGNYRLSNERLSRLVFQVLRDGDKKWFSAFKTKARISEAFMSIGPAIYLLFSLVSRDY